MKLFKAKKGIIIPGKKEDTVKLATVSYTSPEYVYIPLSIKGNDFEVLVKPGDKVKIGQKIAVRKTGVPLIKHATVSGEVVGTERKMHRTGSPYVCIKIKNDFQEEVMFLEPMDFEKATKDELIDRIEEAGIVGLGGAGFPTHAKYRDAENIDTVILNGAECEPYLTSDYRVMIEDTYHVVNGLRILMKTAQAEKGLIVLKEGYKEAYEALVKECAQYDNLQVFLVPNQYPAGWERQVVYRTLKRRYENYPYECGVIVNNISTAVAVSQAVLEGKPLIERVVTVSGEGVVRPGNYRVRIGTLASELIKQAGGLAHDLDEVRIIAGGPMMGVAQKNDDFVITRALTGILVLPGEHKYEVPHKRPVGDVILDILHFTEHDHRYFVRDEQPCVRCGSCVFHCPAGLQPALLRDAALAKDEVRLGKLDVLECIDCGTCAYVCPSHILVNDAIRRGKTYYQVKVKNAK